MPTSLAFSPIIMPYRGTWPRIAASAFVAPGAVIIGDVEIGEEANIWPGCVLRGDVNVIRIGARTNVQDGTVVHVSRGGQGTQIGDDVTIGHMALIHDARLENSSFVGMRATIIDGARVETFAMVGACALVTQGKVVPSGQLWMGSPARFSRTLRDEEIHEITARAKHYVQLAGEYNQN